MNTENTYIDLVNGQWQLVTVVSDSDYYPPPECAE